MFGLRSSRHIISLWHFLYLLVVDIIVVSETSQPVKQRVGFVGNDLTLVATGGHAAVIEVVPFVVGDGFTKGSVVTETDCTKVV